MAYNLTALLMNLVQDVNRERKLREAMQGQTQDQLTSRHVLTQREMEILFANISSLSKQKDPNLLFNDSTSDEDIIDSAEQGK